MATAGGPDGHVRRRRGAIAGGSRRMLGKPKLRGGRRIFAWGPMLKKRPHTLRRGRGDDRHKTLAGGPAVCWGLRRSGLVGPGGGAQGLGKAGGARGGHRNRDGGGSMRGTRPPTGGGAPGGLRVFGPRRCPGREGAKANVTSKQTTCCTADLPHTEGMRVRF